MGGASRVPVIMLTARGEEVDRVVGLEMGADDYRLSRRVCGRAPRVAGAPSRPERACPCRWRTER